MVVNEPGRAGEEDDGSDGQAQPSPPRQFIKRLPASVALCPDWKAPAGQRVNQLLKSTDKRCSPSKRHHMKETEVIWVANCVWLSPSTWLWHLFIKGKGSPAISNARMWPSAASDPKCVVFLCSHHCKCSCTFTGEKVCWWAVGGANRWQGGKLMTSPESQLVHWELYK